MNSLGFILKKESCLTPWLIFGYASPAAGVPAVGFESPGYGGDEPPCVKQCGFLRSGVPFHGRPGRGAARLAGAVPGLSTRPVSAHPFESGKRSQRTYGDHTMSKSTSVDRKTASAINPFIGSICTEDSLSSMALTLGEIGSLLTNADSPQPENLWWVLEAMTCALRWEQENIHSVIQSRQGATT